MNNLVSDKAIIGENVKFGSFNIIEDDVFLGDNVEIGNFCHLKAGVVIGKNTRLMNYIELRPDTVIGEDCYIDSKVSSSGKVNVGNMVTLRYETILARGVVVGDGCYLCPRVMTNNLNKEKDSIGGAKIGANCFIGTNAVLQYGISLGDNTVVGAMSFVNKSFSDKKVLIGIPAKEMSKQ